jgi:hypothetical protein
LDHKILILLYTKRRGGGVERVEYCVGDRGGMQGEKGKYGLATQPLLNIYYCHSLWGQENLQYRISLLPLQCLCSLKFLCCFVLFRSALKNNSMSGRGGRPYMFVSQKNWASDFDLVAQVLCARLKDIMPFHLLSVSTFLFHTKYVIINTIYPY